MATSKTALQKPDEGVSIPSLKPSLEEMGYSGLKHASKMIFEEADVRLRFPQVITEIDLMAKEGMVAAALMRYAMSISSREWTLEAPPNASNKTKERTAICNSMLHDMTLPWEQAMSQAASFNKYGFSLMEVVLYRRLYENGSKYNDGLIGIKKLASRAQHSVSGWIYDPDSNELVAWEQSTKALRQTGSLSSKAALNGSSIRIPFRTKDGLQKTLHFTADATNDNPEGTSPLIASWKSWKLKDIVTQSELTGLARDLGGVMKLTIPARYMSEDASEAEKAVYEYFKNASRNFHNNSQAGLVIPSDTDPETKKALFDLELLNGAGSKGYATNDIISRLNTEILVPLFCDDLLLGSGSNGSNALASAKDSTINRAIEHRLKEMKRVLDTQLVPTIFKANGWELTELPTFKFSELDSEDLEVWSAAVMRIASNGLIEVNRGVLNVVAEHLGLPVMPDDMPVDRDSLTGATSKSGAGASSPTGVGTSQAPSGGNDGKANSSNKG